MLKKRLNEKEFKLIKTMVELGAKTDKLMDASGRSRSTICFIKNSDSYEDYREKLRESKESKVKEIQTSLPIPSDEVIEDSKSEDKLSTIITRLEEVVMYLVAIEKNTRKDE